jgi:N-acetylated-alpha-linked acidic dipeptidase
MQNKTWKKRAWMLGSGTALAALFVALAPGAVPQAAIDGFSPKAAQAELSTEQKVKEAVSAEQIRRYLRYFTAQPHPAGTARNNELARYIERTWKQQGLEDVQLHRYDVLNSTPREVSLEMVSPVHYRASLREAPYAVDPDTKNPDVTGSFFGYSASGEVTAPVVYARSGNPEDYALLKKNGIDVRGKIVLVRYSNPYSYRGFKALTAQRLGAAAILVYSDPAEDGYKQGKVYPHGPWGPESHIQRGSITYDFNQPGDPLTPGWPSLPGAKRILPSQAVSLPKIIGIPLSWKDAKPLLENMGGPVAPKSWQGGLPITYHLGGQRVRVHLKVEMNNEIQPYYVVEGRITGAELPNEWVVTGNHRDGWVFGAVDPSSGTAAMMELTGILGRLKKEGIRPRRTMVFCSWDGEEYALTGSTEWGEQYAAELRKKAVAYLNVDEAVSGPHFQASSVPSLVDAVVGATRGLQDPAGGTLYEAWKKWRESQAPNTAAAKVLSDDQLPQTRLGSGSDYTVFLNHLGIPVVDFTSAGPYGVYHSVYDDFYWMEHFADPGFHYHALMTRYWGVLALRMANAQVLPYDFAFYGKRIRQFAEELKVPQGAPLDLKPMIASATAFEQAAAKLDTQLAERLQSGNLDPALADKINHQLMQVDRNWLDREGIPGRPWFRQILYAPKETYADEELPGVTEAIAGEGWVLAQAQAAVIEHALRRNTALVNSILAELKAGGGAEAGR